MRRDTHVFQPQRFQGFEAEDVADDGRREVRDRPFFEEIDDVRDVGDVLVRSRHGIDAVALPLVVVVGGQPVGPDDGPRSGGRLARDGGAGFIRLDALLGHEAESAQNVGILGRVVGPVVAHLLVRRDAGGPPTFLFAITAMRHWDSLLRGAAGCCRGSM
jgi:hypothetical protein